jgi:BirA family biotin operon repressor/biotin-[acetyl-CoA-carboxylase] ligase
MHGVLAPERVAPLLRGRFGHPYVHRRACPSTQRLLDLSLPTGAVAVCEEQTEGRGRLGRGWEAPAGSSILCSVLLRPPPPHAPAELSLVGGLAVAVTVERATGIPTGLKWPNDALARGFKVAGVLAEARGAAVVLGIGLNVNQIEAELPRRPRYPAASLRTLDGLERDPAPLFADLLAVLEELVERWGRGGLAELRTDLEARDVLRGRRVRIGTIEGIAAGIGDDGRLLVDTGSGRVPVAGGEPVTEPPGG